MGTKAAIDGVDREELIRRRELKKLSPSEMARRLELTRGVYHNYETGRRKIPVRVAVQACKILECSIEEIVLTPPTTVSPPPA